MEKYKPLIVNLPSRFFLDAKGDPICVDRPLISVVAEDGEKTGTLRYRSTTIVKHCPSMCPSVILARSPPTVARKRSKLGRGWATKQVLNTHNVLKENCEFLEAIQRQNMSDILVRTD